MATLVQHKTNSGGSNTGGSVTVTATGAGNLLVAVVCTDSATTDAVSSITDGTSNFTQVASARATNSGGQTVDVWWLASSNSGKTSITLLLNQATFWGIEVFEVSGIVTPAVDSKGVLSNGAMSGTIATGPVVTVTSPVFAVAGISSNNTGIAAQNVFTSGGDVFSGENGASSSLITTVTATPTWTATTGSNSFAASAVFFKDAAAAGGGGWSGSGTRRAPAKAGPFDQRGFLLSPYQRYSYAESATVAAAVTTLQRKTLSPLGTHTGGRQSQ